MLHPAPLYPCDHRSNACNHRSNNNIYRLRLEGGEQSGILDLGVSTQRLHERSTVVISHQLGKAALDQSFAHRRGNSGAVLSDKAQRQVRLQVGR